MQKYSGKNSISRKNNHISNDLTRTFGAIKCGGKNVKLIYKILFIIILLLFLAFFTNGNVAYGLGNSDAQNTIENDLIEEIENQLGKLEFGDLDTFVQKIEKDIGKLFNSSTKELMQKIMRGEFITDFDGFMDFLFTNMKNILYKYIPIMCFIVFISVLAGILEGVTSGFINKQTNEIINFVCYSAIVIVLFTALNGILTEVKVSVTRLKTLMDITFPILLTFMVALGGVTSPTMYKPIMLVLSNVIVGVIAKIIVPFFIAGLVLSVVGNMSNSIKLTKLPKYFMSVSSWILGMMFSIFSSFVTLRGISGISVDNISINATKFAISSYVPILGGYVSDGFDLVLASCSLIKNTFGVTILVITIFTVILPIIKIVFFVLMLRFVEAIIEPMCDSKISNMLNSVSKNLIVLISALVGLAFMFFVLVLLIIFTFRFSY